MSEETAPAIPYIKLLGHQDPAEVLAATPALFAVLLDRLTPGQVEHKPGPTKWNIREIIAHMADCEIAWSWRLRQIFGEDNPTVQPFEQDPWSKSYGSYSLAQARSTWGALRAWNVAFLGGLSEADRCRRATHPELGRISLWTVASIAAGHDLHHLQSLKRVVDSFHAGADPSTISAS